MKKKISLINPMILFCFAVLVGMLFVSWDIKQQPVTSQVVADTLPVKEKKVRDLDAAIAELDRIDIQLEVEKAMKEVNAALKDLDAAKINKEIQAAIKEVDFAKIKAEIAEAMKEVDAVKIQADVQASLAKIDWEKIQDEIKKVEKIDLTALEKELAGVKEEMQQLQPKLEKEMLKAKEELVKAQETLKEYKSFVEGLEKEGLLNQKEGYSIEHKDGKLIINGKEASPKTYEKHEPFLKKHKNLNIRQSTDNAGMTII